ncbi:hypothetical protein JHK85_010372 [Glycine max]|nr:hypothetical protein JHK85_010372 [Glycine max]
MYVASLFAQVTCTPELISKSSQSEMVCSTHLVAVHAPENFHQRILRRVLDRLVFMAEEKEGQGTNPPQEQPNEPLPSECYSQNCSFQIYSGFVRLARAGSEKKIKEEMSRAEIQVVPPGYFVTADFKPQRVRLYVDESNKVTSAPRIG